MIVGCIVQTYVFFFSSRRRHTRCALVTGVQTCALPIYTLPYAPSARATTLPSLSVLLIVIVVPESPFDPQAASGATAVRRISERHIARLLSCIVRTIHYDRTRCASRRGDEGPALRHDAPQHEYPARQDHARRAAARLSRIRRARRRAYDADRARDRFDAARAARDRRGAGGAGRGAGGAHV